MLLEVKRQLFIRVKLNTLDERRIKNVKK